MVSLIEFRRSSHYDAIVSRTTLPDALMSTKTVAKAASNKSGEEDETASGTFRAITRTMNLLRCLSHHPQGLTLTELSNEAGLHKATVSRFLKALEHDRFVTANGKTWKLGSSFFEIGTRAIGHTDLREMARPFMESACHEIGATVQLASLVDDGVVYVEKVEPLDLPLKINTQIGSRRPLHCTALGKVLAASRDWPEVEAILARTGMRQMTARSITDPMTLKAELERVREQGYAVDDHEYNELVACVAAPVRNASGNVIAGLSISTFGIEVDSPRFRMLVETSVSVAGAISAAFGWRADPAR
jgi:DNA-binding IclR family transcriptional regulator